MKKFLLLVLLFIGVTSGVFAQKFALIDMDYILKNITSYQKAKKEIENEANNYHLQIIKLQNESKNLYKVYQLNMGRMTQTAKNRRENAIVEKENQIQELNKKYFGPEGELAKKKQDLITPIENSIYDAVKVIALKNNYQMVIDRASNEKIIFASPLIDISKDVLSKMGY